MLHGATIIGDYWQKINKFRNFLLLITLIHIKTQTVTGMAFVKTSTGFGTGGAISMALFGDVKLMKSVVGEDLGVKASGPIPNYDTAVSFIHAGAHRIGSRRGVDIVKGSSD